MLGAPVAEVYSAVALVMLGSISRTSTGSASSTCSSSSTPQLGPGSA